VVSAADASVARWSLAWFQALLWRLVLSASLAVAGAVLMLRSTAEDPQKNYAASREAVLAFQPPTLPAAENAAPDYKKAFIAFTPFSGPSELDPGYNLTRDSKFFEDPGVLAHLTANAATLAALDAATAKERVNWNYDYSLGYKIRQINLLTMRNTASLLGARARVLARRGDHTAAASDLRRMQVMARHLSSDPFLINGMVGLAMQSDAGEVMQATLLYDTPVKAADIEAYRKAFDDGANPHVDFARHCDFEFALQAYTIDGVATASED
jgi:hypothetical protein